MTDSVENHCDLWSDGAPSKYVLVDLSKEGRLDQCAILTVFPRLVTIISDPAIATEVKRLMLAAGVPMVTDLPPG